jgi:hypothetical protein
MMFRLSVSGIAFYQTSASEMNGAAKQISGREGETATLLIKLFREIGVVRWRFRPTSSHLCCGDG